MARKPKKPGIPKTLRESIELCEHLLSLEEYIPQEGQPSREEIKVLYEQMITVRDAKKKLKAHREEMLRKAAATEVSYYEHLMAFWIPITLQMVHDFPMHQPY